MPTKKEATTKKQAAAKPEAPEKELEAAALETETPVATGELTDEEVALEEAGLDDATEEAGDKGAITLKQGRRKLVKQMQTHDKDTGSTEVQVALLTGKINDLVKHLKEHPQDNDSRQGLLKMVGRRRRLLRFLKKGSESKYQGLIAELKLRK